VARLNTTADSDHDSGREIVMQQSIFVMSFRAALPLAMIAVHLIEAP